MFKFRELRVVALETEPLQVPSHSAMLQAVGNLQQRMGSARDLGAMKSGIFIAC